METSSYKRWTMPLLEMKDDGIEFKVTRGIPEMAVSETLIFKNKEDALKQIQEWLQ